MICDDMPFLHLLLLDLMLLLLRQPSALMLSLFIASLDYMVAVSLYFLDLLSVSEYHAPACVPL
jgi:hypothetical protein